MKVYQVISIHRDEDDLDWYEGMYKKRLKAEKKAAKVRKKYPHLKVKVISRKVK